MPRASMSNAGQVSHGTVAPSVGKASTVGGKRRATGSTVSRASSGSNAGSGSNAMGLRIYTDDAKGLKIGPTTVLILSLLFIGCVIGIHVFGKLRRV